MTEDGFDGISRDILIIGGHPTSCYAPVVLYQGGTVRASNDLWCGLAASS
jgi:hypothetical protein